MGTFETIVLAGLVLGVAQLGVGVAIGLWIGRRRVAAGRADLQRAQQLATDLDGLAAKVEHSVQGHSTQVARLDERLREEDTTGGKLTEMVVGVVSELLGANGQLIADLQQARRELAERLDELNEHRKQALTDALTGLPNRRAFDGHFADQVETWRKRQMPFSLMMIDVDRFKQFNDTHGHQAGDEALRVVATGLREALRSHDLVARYGGEEFAVLLPNTEISTARPAVEKVLRSVESRDITTPTGVVNATVSVGVATILPQERSETLLQRADSALYAAKEQGRNQAWAHDGDSLTLLLPSEEAESRVEQACDALTASLADFMNDSGDGSPQDAGDLTASGDVRG